MSVAAAVAPLARALARATLAAMPVIFHIPDVDTEIEDDLVDLLLEELTLTARPDAPFDGEQAARTIGHARGGDSRSELSASGANGPDQGRVGGTGVPQQ